MATNTISLDDEAFERLAKARRADETLSEVVKRIVPPHVDFYAWLKSIRADPFGDEFVAAVEERVQGRKTRTRR